MGSMGHYAESASARDKSTNGGGHIHIDVDSISLIGGGS